MIMTCTLVGGFIGYCFHRYEENSEARLQRLLDKYRDPPVLENVNWAVLPSSTNKNKGKVM